MHPNYTNMVNMGENRRKRENHWKKRKVQISTVSIVFQKMVWFTILKTSKPAQDPKFSMVHIPIASLLAISWHFLIPAVHRYYYNHFGLFRPNRSEKHDQNTLISQSAIYRGHRCGFLQFSTVWPPSVAQTPFIDLSGPKMHKIGLGSTQFSFLSNLWIFRFQPEN